MQLKKSKKGFTLVELVIVIAVIAILAAVLVPTFVGVSRNAKKSAAMQEATTARTVVLAGFGSENISLANGWIKSGDYWFALDAAGALDTEAKDAPTEMATCYQVNFDDAAFSDLKGSEIKFYLSAAPDNDGRATKGALAIDGKFTPATGGGTAQLTV